jgi:hypothetical protein
MGNCHTQFMTVLVTFTHKAHGLCDDELMNTNTHIQTNTKASLTKGALIIESPDAMPRLVIAGLPENPSRVLLGMPRSIVRIRKKKEAPVH